MNDRYEFLEGLGRGTFGEVYRVWDKHLDSECALKLLTPQRGQPADWTEARLLERTRSDFLVPINNADVVINSDIRFITMPVMEGGDLNALAHPHGVEVRQALRWGQQLAHALDRVHAEGLVHRDVKPGNAFLSEGNALLGDLGTAVFVDPQTGLAPAIGTTATLAPEAVPQHGHTARASDVYSLAASVFYLLSGEYPIDARLPDVEQRRRVAAGDRRKLRDLAPHVSRSIATVVEKGMSTNPGDRHESALALGNALAGASDHPRSWRRVVHAGHAHCLEGARLGRPTISICVESVGSKLRATARGALGRRPRGLQDVEVGQTGLPQVLRRWTESLR